MLKQLLNWLIIAVKGGEDRNKESDKCDLTGTALSFIIILEDLTDPLPEVEGIESSSCLLFFSVCDSSIKSILSTSPSFC